MLDADALRGVSAQFQALAGPIADYSFNLNVGAHCALNPPPVGESPAASMCGLLQASMRCLCAALRRRERSSPGLAVVTANTRLSSNPKPLKLGAWQGTGCAPACRDTLATLARKTCKACIPSGARMTPLPGRRHLPAQVETTGITQQWTHRTRSSQMR